MKSKYTAELVAARIAAVKDGRFIHRTMGGKIECVACGGNGYPEGSWMDKHMAGHSQCPECGKTNPTSSMGQHRAVHRR